MSESNLSPASLSDKDLIAAAIAKAGLSARAFAGKMGRNERTIREWLSGRGKLNAAARTWLETYLRDGEESTLL